MEISPVFTLIHQGHKELISPAQLWRTAKVSYFFLYCEAFGLIPRPLRRIKNALNITQVAACY